MINEVEVNRKAVYPREANVILYKMRDSTRSFKRFVPTIQTEQRRSVVVKRGTFDYFFHNITKFREDCYELIIFRQRS